MKTNKSRYISISLSTANRLFVNRVVKDQETWTLDRRPSGPSVEIFRRSIKGPCLTRFIEREKDLIVATYLKSTVSLIGLSSGIASILKEICLLSLAARVDNQTPYQVVSGPGILILTVGQGSILGWIQVEVE